MAGMKFPEKLRTRIKAAGLTQDKLARAIGVDPSRVSEWVNEKSEPSFSQAVAVARQLGISLEFLADDNLDEPSPGLGKDEENFLALYRMVREGKLSELTDLIRDFSQSSRYAGNPSFAPSHPPLIEDQTPPGEAPATGAKRTA